MKISTFLKGLFITSLFAGAISSAVVFSNVNVISTPSPKVLTKENYLKMRSEQNISLDDKTTPLIIDYNLLPSSDLNLKDLVTQNGIRTNAFILTVGSQAYSTTNSILSGNNKDWGFFNPYAVDNSALMLKLYDLFYNEQSEHHLAVKDYSINFYSLIDIVWNKDVIKAQELLQYRRTQLGEKPLSTPENNNGVSVGQSNVWKVDDPDSNNDILRPVVKMPSSGAIEFNYKPEDAYYEFLPNDEYDTEYQKVYFRNQKIVNLFKNSIEWLNNYSKQYLQGFDVSPTGSIVCAKYDDKETKWLFKSFTSSSGINDIISFYNSEYDINGDNNENNDEQSRLNNYSQTRNVVSNVFSSNNTLVDSNQNLKRRKI